MNPIIAAVLVLAIGLIVVGPLDYSSSLVTAAHVREADHRKELPPEQLAEIGYWRRHEQRKADCRGQTYVAQCCDHSLHADTVTCLNPKEIR